MKKELKNLLHLQKEHVAGKPRITVEGRRARLKAIQLWIERHLEEIYTALYKDFRRPAAEVSVSEIYPVLSEIRLAMKNLESWVHPVRVKTPSALLGTSSTIHYEPLGVCLIISPWNYPFNLAIGPLVSAIAAGNSVILKPSELSPHTTELISGMISQIFPPEEVSVVSGDAETGAYLVSLPFDHIFFTGSVEVGKKIMAAASANMTSVTLELGGKSPVFVDGSANLEEAAEKIAWGKLVNNGQTCIAPDYALVISDKLDEFITLLVHKMELLYSGPDFQKSPDYSRIVNEHHFQRLEDLLTNSTEHGAKIIYGGDRDAEDLYISPTIITNLQQTARIYSEEVFGPILPVFPVTDVQAAIAHVNSMPKPLSAYVFSGDEGIYRTFAERTSSGSICWNTCLIQFGNPNLPFGGVNQSGMGRSHGVYGFRSFSNERSQLIAHTGVSLKAIMPPYTPVIRKITSFIMKYF